MLGRDYEDQICSIARTLETVGERWTLLIIRDVLLGVTRFDDIRRSLGIARNVLTDRLNKLVDAGILERAQYQTQPARYEYQATQQGRELFPVLLALMHWGDRHRAGVDGPPRLARHDACGGDVTLQLACGTCGAVDPASVSVEPGPALTRRADSVSG